MKNRTSISTPPHLRLLNTVSAFITLAVLAACTQEEPSFPTEGVEGDYGLINNSYNTRITSLTLNDMERIEQARLGNMVALQSITLPKATDVGAYAFGNSPNLSVVSLTAEGPITLGENAFGSNIL